MTRNERGVYIAPNGKKTFIPLENSPAVFTALARRLGAAPELTFHDIYDLSDPTNIPRPAHAINFISPAKVYHRVRGPNPSRELTYNSSGPSEPVLWFKQTIGHACGLIALLHSLLNGPARRYILPNSTLDRIREQALPLKPLPRAQLLHDSVDLEEAHMSAARAGDTATPDSREPNGYHFISFVRGEDGHLYELEGGSGSDGPIDRGELGGEEDMLSPAAVEKGVMRFVRAAEGSLEFSVVALTG